MAAFLPTAIASRLEKAAVDNGFDGELPAVGDWLAFASTQCPLSICLDVTAGAEIDTVSPQDALAMYR